MVIEIGVHVTGEVPMKMGKGSCYSRRNSGEWNRAVVGRRKASEWQTDRLRVECGGDDAGAGCVRNGCGSEETKPDEQEFDEGAQNSRPTEASVCGGPRGRGALNGSGPRQDAETERSN